MKQIEVVAGVIFRQGRILITQRLSHVAWGSYWEFPGGKIEPGESPEQALVRECLEECGIDVAVGTLIERTQSENPLLTLRFYRCVWIAKEVELLGVQDCAWVLAKDLGSYTFPPSNKAILGRLTDGSVS